MSLADRECPVKCNEQVDEGSKSKSAFHPVAQRLDPDPTEAEIAIEIKAPELKPVVEMAEEAANVSKEDAEVEKHMDKDKEPEKFKDAAENNK